mmetsp:Transcript_285/g.737  ORF Transcript_285/g.737 Transcript_285/m.737 type:complete len:332 (+) Transcript_285:421-1416(+)
MVADELTEGVRSGMYGTGRAWFAELARRGWLAEDFDTERRCVAVSACWNSDSGRESTLVCSTVEPTLLCCGDEGTHRTAGGGASNLCWVCGVLPGEVTQAASTDTAGFSAGGAKMTRTLLFLGIWLMSSPGECQASKCESQNSRDVISCFVLSFTASLMSRSEIDAASSIVHIVGRSLSAVATESWKELSSEGPALGCFFIPRNLSEAFRTNKAVPASFSTFFVPRNFSKFWAVSHSCCEPLILLSSASCCWNLPISSSSFVELSLSTSASISMHFASTALVLSTSKSSCRPALVMRSPMFLSSVPTLVSICFSTFARREEIIKTDRSVTG